MTVVDEFHIKYDLPRPAQPPVQPDRDLVFLRLRLIKEEYEEVAADLRKLLAPQHPDERVETYRALLKELCDLRYVVEGCAVAFGLDIEAAYLEVHRSNMSKSGMERGKVTKGPDYEPPDLTSLVEPIIDV